jgi:short-subunit dehydrogenase
MAPGVHSTRSMTKPIADQVVVITGASQGIGRETALQLARRGASVVVSARNEVALRDLVREIAEVHGGQAEPVVTDVAEWDQVERLAEAAMGRFGRIDTWVNNAAVSLYGTVEQLDPAEMERLVAVNLLGQMYGSKAAVARMKDRGGTIINVGSALSERAIPLQSVYVATKHGVQGFSEALRLELMHEEAGIDVVVILPSSTNTPLFNFARSKLGVMPMPVPPVYQPTAVAEAICHAAEHGGREIVVGGWGKLLVAAQRLSPSLLDRYMLQGSRSFEQQKTDRPDDRRDNLFEPSTGRGSSTGEFGDASRPTSVYTTLFELHPNRKRGAFAALLVALVTALRRIGR